jgi:hypothetical protein
MVNIKCVSLLYGKSDSAITETVTFLWSLPYSGDLKTNLTIFSGEERKERPYFDFAALQAEQLANILDANRERCFKLETGIGSVDKSVTLATRTYPLNLNLRFSAVF